MTNPPAAVQVDISKILNVRVVATVTDGKVHPFKVALDGGGGVATFSAAALTGIKNDHMVPNDGKFPANTDHPDVVLHYADGDGDSNQARISPKGSEDEYSFDVPPNKYAKMFLFYTSGSSGPAPLQVSLTYQDGSTDEHDVIVPDWYKILKPTDKDVVYLAYNLAKWGIKNTILENDHHSIMGVDVRPTDKPKVLTQIKVHKTRPTVVFWGATGQLAN